MVAPTAVAAIKIFFILLFTGILQSVYHHQSLNKQEWVLIDIQKTYMKQRFTHVYLKLGFAIVIVLFVSCHSSRRSIGIEEGWELLGEQKVNFVRDKDEIIVHNKAPYTAMRFKVEERDVHIKDLKVYFQNGDKLEPNIDDDIQAGEFSRVIDLGREGRYIDHIEFNYRTTGNVLKGRANVLVLGKKYYRDY